MNSVFVIACASGLVAAVMWRLHWLRGFPVGLGYNARSPDGKFQTFATTMHDCSFFGTRSAFYRFELVDRQTERTICEVESKRMPEEAAVDLSECRILWTEDCSRVRVVAGELELWQYEIRG